MDTLAYGSAQRAVNRPPSQDALPQEAGGGRGAPQRPRQQLPHHEPDHHGDRDPGQQGDGEVASDEAAAQRAGLGGADQREPADRRGPGLDQIAHTRRRHLRGHRLAAEHPRHVRLLEHRGQDAGVARSAGRHDHHRDALAGEHVDDAAHPDAGAQPTTGLGQLGGDDVGLLGEHGAALHGATVEEHGARAALARVAADVCAGQPEPVA